MKIRPFVVRVSSYLRFRRGPTQYTGCPASSETARSRAAVAAPGPMAAGVRSSEVLDDEAAVPRSGSQTTNAAATAIATTAPIRRPYRRLRPMWRSSLTVGKNKSFPGGHERKRAGDETPGPRLQCGLQGG